MAQSKTRKARDKSKRAKAKKNQKAAPPKKKTVTLRNLNDDDGEVDFETLVKEEYMRLHRQYRLMEDARHVIAEKGNNLSKKGQLLEMLRAEREDLLTDLKNADCETYREKDRKSVRTILQILQDYENCNADIEECHKSIKEMESNVDKITQKLVDQKLKVQALYGRSMTVPQCEHRQRVLENRLYHVTTKFDTKVTNNKELREEINMMLKLHGIFFERMITMKKQANRIKRRMGEIVYLATQAYEQRDDWVAKIRALRDKNEKDSKQHVLGIKEFKRILHNDSKLHAFMQLKNMERLLMENNIQRTDRKNQAKLIEVDAMLSAYKRSFREILNMAESDNIETIVTNYLGQEQTNFSRFKYITDVNHETNALREQNIAMAKEIEQLYLETKEIEHERQEELASMSAMYETENEKLDRVIEIWEKAESQMDEVIRLLDLIFSMANCDNTPIIRLLGNLNGISPRNARLCMKVIENRIGELLFEKAKYEIRKVVEIDKGPVPKKQVYGTGAQKSKPAGGPFLPKITVTGRLDGEAEGEDDDRAFNDKPIPYSEMRKRVLEKIALTSAVENKNADGAPSVLDTALDSPAGSDESIKSALARRSEALVRLSASRPGSNKASGDNSKPTTDSKPASPSEQGADATAKPITPPEPIEPELPPETSKTEIPPGSQKSETPPGSQKSETPPGSQKSGTPPEEPTETPPSDPEEQPPASSTPPEEPADTPPWDPEEPPADSSSQPEEPADTPPSDPEEQPPASSTPPEEPADTPPSDPDAEANEEEE